MITVGCDCNHILQRDMALGHLVANTEAIDDRAGKLQENQISRAFTIHTGRSSIPARSLFGTLGVHSHKGMTRSTKARRMRCACRHIEGRDLAMSDCTFLTARAGDMAAVLCASLSVT